MAALPDTGAGATAEAPATPVPAPSGRLARILALDDFEAAARRHLPRPVFGYVAGAAETDWTLADNRRAFG